MREKRKKIWIDRFQTYLVVRIALYFVLYQAAVWAFVYLERSSFAAMEAMVGEAATRSCIFFAAVIVVFVGLLFTYDAVKFAHRIVGPLYRFRKTMQAVAAGEEVALIRLREGDLLLEMKDDFNEMLRALEERGAVTLKPVDAKPAAKQPAGV